MAAGAALAMSHPSPDHDADWKCQASPANTNTIEIPAPKRRRSAHVAQQESTIGQTVGNSHSSYNDSKRRRSELSPVSISPTSERARKDSKRTFTDEEDMPTVEFDLLKSDVMAQCEDPFELEPDGTMLFLDLFFAQSAREVHLMFPRHAFSRWVKTCNGKCQRECMVLYAVLALGSVFGKQEFSSFAKLCVERATRAAASFYGRFSMALVQTRLLLGAYSQLKGKDGLSSDYNGSALRAIGAMRLNTEEGCGDDLDEYARPYYSFTQEQLRECRRRTFWAAFLMDVGIRVPSSC